MSPKTGDRVKHSRLVQLVVRVLTLLGTLGLLFCVIVINKTSSSVAWIIRVAPAVALLHTGYAVYHLRQAPTARTPISSASYMIFAAVVDTGLIPFLVFTAYVSYSEYATKVYGWETLLKDPETTAKIIQATFYLSIILGGLLLISFGVGIYLTIIFRKISHLPPDMNPLEPNLTARPHKRNKSEFAASMSPSEKYMSRTSLVPSSRLSMHPDDDPLNPLNRRVPFMHTRTDSAESVVLNPGSDLHTSQVGGSRPTSLYQHSNHSCRGSYAVLEGSQTETSSSPSQSWAAPSFTTAKTGGTGVGFDHRPARSSNLVVNGQLTMREDNRSVSPLGPDHGERRDSYSPNRAAEHVENAARPVSPISYRSSVSPDRSPRHGGNLYAEGKNWYTSPPRGRQVGAPSSHNYSSKDKSGLRQTLEHGSPASVNRAPFIGADQSERRGSLYDFERDLGSPDSAEKNQHEVRNPLGMHPPTPIRATHEQQQEHGNDTKEDGEDEEPKRYSLYDAPVNLSPPLSRQSSRKSASKPSFSANRPSSFVGSGSKGKYYGDLRSPAGSVIKPRGGNNGIVFDGDVKHFDRDGDKKDSAVYGGDDSSNGNHGSDSSSNSDRSNSVLSHSVDTASDYSNHRTETMDSHIEIHAYSTVGGDDDDDDDDDDDGDNNSGQAVGRDGSNQYLSIVDGLGSRFDDGEGKSGDDAKRRNMMDAGIQGRRRRGNDDDDDGGGVGGDYISADCGPSPYTTTTTSTTSKTSAKASTTTTTSSSQEDIRDSDRKGRVVSNSSYDYGHVHDYYHSQSRDRTSHVQEATAMMKRQQKDTNTHDLSAGYAGLGVEFGQGMGRRRVVTPKALTNNTSSSAATASASPSPTRGRFGTAIGFGGGASSPAVGFSSSASSSPSNPAKVSTGSTLQNQSKNKNNNTTTSTAPWMNNESSRNSSRTRGMRDVSGKIVEEGRAGGPKSETVGWANRFGLGSGIGGAGSSGQHDDDDDDDVGSRLLDRRGAGAGGGGMMGKKEQYYQNNSHSAENGRGPTGTINNSTNSGGVGSVGGAVMAAAGWARFRGL